MPLPPSRSRSKSKLFLYILLLLFLYFGRRLPSLPYYGVAALSLLFISFSFASSVSHVNPPSFLPPTSWNHRVWVEASASDPTSYLVTASSTPRPSKKRAKKPHLSFVSTTPPGNLEIQVVINVPPAPIACSSSGGCSSSREDLANLPRPSISSSSGSTTSTAVSSPPGYPGGFPLPVVEEGASSLYESELSRLKAYLERNFICDACGARSFSYKQLVAHRDELSGCNDAEREASTG
ncbi:hypothetical protein BDY24DRAFT_378059 [Mrakia frigida]|uniref:uncharacterized protein n=1 Tax=Mrakia frigida TaxID=29902 RepID=UPI003FCBF175